MNKSYKNVLRKVVIICLVIAVVAVAFVYNQYGRYKKGKESVFDAFYMPYKIQKNVDKMYNSPADQHVKVGDYTIALDKLVYSREKQFGWCKFDVTRYGYNMEDEAIANSRDYYVKNYFGRDRQFSVQVAYGSVDGSYTHGDAARFELSDESSTNDVLNVYRMILVEDNNSYNHCVYLYNRNSGKGNGEPTSTQEIKDMDGVFVLYEKDTSLKKYIHTKRGVYYEIIISPDSINIRGDIDKYMNNEHEDIKDIKIYEDDGQVVSIKENGVLNADIRDCGEFVPDKESDLSTYSCVLEFSEKLDVSKVSGVEINGVEAERIEED